MANAAKLREDCLALSPEELHINTTSCHLNPTGIDQERSRLPYQGSPGVELCMDETAIATVGALRCGVCVCVVGLSSYLQYDAMCELRLVSGLAKRLEHHQTLCSESALQKRYTHILLVTDVHNGTHSLITDSHTQQYTLITVWRCEALCRLPCLQ